MRFNNPWIDPRIGQVQSEQATTYLHRHGWHLLGPAENPLFLMFESPNNGQDAQAVLVPLKLDQGPMLQRMIDLVGEVARYENRWAVDVLTDMLRQSADAGLANGPAMPARPEPAPK